MKRLATFIRDLYRESSNDGLLRHSAAVSYYGIFSLPALLLVIFSIVRMVLQRTSVEQDMLEPVRLYMGEGTARLLQEAARSLQEQSIHSDWPAAIGGVLLFIAAIGLVRELQASLNEILKVEQSDATIFHAMVRYLTAIIPLMLVSGILAFSLLLSTIFVIVEERITTVLQLPIDLLQLGNYLLIVVSLTAIFTVLYAVLPAKRYPLRLILSCSFFTATVLFAGSIIVSAFAVFGSIGSIYGVAANVLVLMFWMFFCSNVFFVGAETMDLLSRKSIAK